MSQRNRKNAAEMAFLSRVAISALDVVVVVLSCSIVTSGCLLLPSAAKGRWLLLAMTLFFGEFRADFGHTFTHFYHDT